MEKKQAAAVAAILCGAIDYWHLSRLHVEGDPAVDDGALQRAQDRIAERLEAIPDES